MSQARRSGAGQAPGSSLVAVLLRGAANRQSYSKRGMTRRAASRRLKPAAAGRATTSLVKTGWLMCRWLASSGSLRRRLAKSGNLPTDSKASLAKKGAADPTAAAAAAAAAASSPAASAASAGSVASASDIGGRAARAQPGATRPRTRQPECSANQAGHLPSGLGIDTWPDTRFGEVGWVSFWASPSPPPSPPP